MRKSSQSKRPSILVVAISGRGLASAAAQAGLVPLVLDFFADADTEEIAHACLKFTDPIGRGIKLSPLLDGLSHLAKEAPSPLLGCVAGAGFEDRPELLSKIAEHWAVLGNDSEMVARIKSVEFFHTLDRLRIPHPRTQFEPPSDQGWLTKRRGAAGGSHIARFAGGSPSSSAYFQEMAQGVAVSALFVGNGKDACVLGFSEQWTDPIPASPFRYGGALRPASLSETLQDEMTAAVLKVSAAFKLKGLGSADFIVDEDAGTTLLLEINPRPGATLDIFDEEAQPLLKLHLDAILDGTLPSAPLALDGAMASALVYAPERVRVADDMAWPDWVADRPKARESIDKNRPICTVLARAETKARAKRLVTERQNTILAEFGPKTGGGSVTSGDHKLAKNSGLPSVNALVEPFVESLIHDAAALRVEVSKGSLGECRIDCGVKAIGGVEAGRRMAEICLGGLGRVAIEVTEPASPWPFVVTVHTSQPVLACLGSQYAGWSLSVDEKGKKYNVLGSGPARALGSSEKLFEELHYRDKANSGCLVLEADSPPPEALVELVAKACNVKPEGLTFVYAPTSSLAGTVQIVARCLEVALHKSHELHFPLEHIVDGIATAPLPPPAPSFIAAMGRTNDAIIYGGRVQLYVSGEVKAARELAEQLPSIKSKDYGKPFADIFAAVKGDFYAIDRMLFSPAMVTVTALKTGESFEAGHIDTAILARSFSS